MRDKLPELHKKFINKYGDAKICYEHALKDLTTHKESFKEIEEAERTGIVSKELLKKLIENYKNMQITLMSMNVSNIKNYGREMDEAKSELENRGYSIDEIETIYKTLNN